MNSLSGQYTAANKLILELREGLEQLERFDGAGVLQETGLARDLRAKFGDLKNLSHEMDRTWRVLVMQESGSKRQIWQRKVQVTVEETECIGHALDKHATKVHRKMAEEKDRAELLSRFSSGAMSTSYDPESGALESASNSNKMVDELLATGMSVLSNMAEQRERLKGAQRKMLDVLNTTGLSESLLR
eukprot:gene9214-10921_t